MSDYRLRSRIIKLYKSPYMSQIKYFKLNIFGIKILENQ